ncbi:MAG: hypothetical protein R2795_14040 [Saprospiraceae bacterium]
MVTHHGVTQYEYNLTTPTGSTGWTRTITDTELLVEGLNNDDQAVLEVRAYFANNVNNCPIEIGTSSCIADFCTLEIMPATITDVSCYGGSRWAIGSKFCKWRVTIQY